MSRRGPLRPRPWHLLLLALVCPLTLLAMAGASGLPDLLLVVAVMLVAGKLFGEGAERLGLPPVLGAPLGRKLIFARQEGVT